MAAPVNYLADMLGNAMDYLGNDPQIAQMGHATGLAYDMATNAPMSTAYNMPHYDHEEEDRK